MPDPTRGQQPSTDLPEPRTAPRGGSGVTPRLPEPRTMPGLIDEVALEPAQAVRANALLLAARALTMGRTPLSPRTPVDPIDLVTVARYIEEGGDPYEVEPSVASRVESVGAPPPHPPAEGRARPLRETELEARRVSPDA